MASPAPPPTPTPNDGPSPITPIVALQLRVRWLEALINGLRPVAPAPSPSSSSQTLTRRAQAVQDQLNAIVRTNDALRHFLDKWTLYSHLLTPSFALSSNGAPQEDAQWNTGALDVLMSDMEPDIRSADSALREIAALEDGGATGAGKLAEHEALQPRLRALVQAHEADMDLAGKLEGRVAEILRRYAAEIDALSELFVSWNGTINEVEERVAAMERDHAEKKRLGLVA